MGRLWALRGSVASRGLPSKASWGSVMGQAAQFVLFAALLSVLAVVVPNVSRAGAEDRNSELATYLLEVRSKIELYKYGDYYITINVASRKK